MNQGEIGEGQRQTMAKMIFGSFYAIVDALISLAKFLIILMVLLFVIFHWSYFSDWARTISHAEVFGIKLDRQEVDKHIAVFKNREQPFNADWLGSALKEADLLAPAIQGGRVVWVDSHPQNNSDERELLQQLGINVQVVWSTQQLIDFLDLGGKADLIISNIPRDGAENPIVPLKKCPARYVDFPNEDFARQYNNNLNKLNEDKKDHPPAGLAMAEILATKLPDVFAINQRPKIIYYSASNGGKIFSPCSIVTTNRADI